MSNELEIEQAALRILESKGLPVARLCAYIRASLNQEKDPSAREVVTYLDNIDDARRKRLLREAKAYRMSPEEIVCGD